MSLARRRNSQRSCPGIQTAASKRIGYELSGCPTEADWAAREVAAVCNLDDLSVAVHRAPKPISGLVLDDESAESVRTVGAAVNDAQSNITATIIAKASSVNRLGLGSSPLASLIMVPSL